MNAREPPSICFYLAINIVFSLDFFPLIYRRWAGLRESEFHWSLQVNVFILYRFRKKLLFILIALSILLPGNFTSTRAEYVDQ